jgi:hypothetical protein
VNIKKVTGGAWSSCSWVRLGPCRHFDKKIQISRHFVPRSGGKKMKDKTSRQVLNFYTAAKEKFWSKTTVCCKSDGM